jgi:LmbE family N-acetylglucosaminyl deacetylase
MVVAHPDDETIFGGHYLEQEGWTVLCVTNGYKPYRKQEFQRAMEIAHAEGVIWDYLDKLDRPLDSEVESKIRSFVEEGDFSRFMSHGENGEYGHLHHKQIHKWMKAIVGDRLETFDLSLIKLTDMAQAYRSQSELYKWLIPL